MSNPKREELSVKQKRAILVAVHSPQSPISKENILNELHGLVKTAGVKVVGEMVQMRDKPHIATCLGKGKVEELEQLIDQTDAELIVFDNNLTPAQGRNLEEALNTVIVDRSEVILDIFASSASTHEAMLQVELAQLLYFRPRLKRLWTHLERIEGGVGTGRGPGEKQLETDRRLLDKRVSELKAKLKIIEGRRHRMVETRSAQPTVSLVGYTNAGKSTLMRKLTGADVLVADKLFATLDTRTRCWHLPNWGELLLSDTVGFVRNLPHHLVASFRSTLEEARYANLLLHVVDASHPEAELQIATVYKVLEEVGVECENVLLVLNKLDACEDRSLVDVLRLQYDNVVTISAVTGEGLDRLYDAIRQRMGTEHVEVTIETSAGNGKLISDLAKHAEVLETDYHDSRVTFHCRILKQYLYRFQNDEQETTVQVIE